MTLEHVDVEQDDIETTQHAELTPSGRDRLSLPLWARRARGSLQREADRFERWIFSLGSRALAAALGVIILGVVLNAIVAYISISTITDRNSWVAHTQLVLAQIATVQTDLLDAQTGARGYVITGDQSYLRPYTAAAASVDDDLRMLRALTVDNPTQLVRIGTLNAQIPQELSELQAEITLRGAGQTSQANARVATGVDQRQMITIRSELKLMQSTENTLLHARDASAQDAVRAAVISVTVAVLADLALLGAVYVVLRRALRVREHVVAEGAKTEARARLFALEETNRRMEEFLAVAGHELRTPLTSALANVQIAERQLARFRDGAASPNTEQLGRILAATEGQLRRQARLVDDLLDVTRIESGNLQFRLEELDLSALVRHTVEEQQRIRSDRQIELRLPANGDAALIFADADRIGQVLTNYLTNALKYSPSSAPVEVEVVVEAQIARVSVRDRGPGLPHDERDRVWGRFHRAAGIEVQSGSGVGLGLGLFISRSFVVRHGGSVGVDVRTDGAGSDFWFTLPLAQTSDAPLLAEQAKLAERAEA